MRLLTQVSLRFVKITDFRIRHISKLINNLNKKRYDT